MKKSILMALAAVALSTQVSGQNVKTYAGKQYLGSGDYNSTPNNNLADELFSMPMGICVDNNNRLWVTDMHNVMILDGGTSRIRGGFLGDPTQPGAIGIDNGTATVSRFNMPSGVCVNKNTNDVYIVDTDNALIRKGTQFVNVSNGTVFSTIAGNYSFTGDHKDGLVADAYFSSPSDIEINSVGEMYICDFGNEVIRKISSGKVTTIAGKPKTSGDANGVGSNAMFYAPSGIFLEDDNNMLIADRNNKKIKRLNLKTNEVTTVISSGLNMPSDIVSANGKIYIADETCIKVFDGTTLKVYAGQASTVGYVDGQAKDARFGYLGLFTYRKADSAFFITDISNNVIRRLTFQDPPVVDFVANKTAVNVSQTVALTSTCSNNTISYAWSISPNTYTLQSNSKLTDKNIFVSFSAVGSYTITFVGANLSADKTQVVKSNYINVSSLSAAKPVVDFAADITNPMTTQTVRLVDLSDNLPTSWTWSITPNTYTLMNATTSASRNMDVKFNALGSYSVTLKATNTTGTDQVTKTNYIQVVLSANKDLPVKQVVFYPNPAKGVLNILGINSIVSATLQSLDGKSAPVSFEGNQINLSDVSAGIYFATVKDESGRVYQTKVVINP
jgi:PKD repeat protein